MPTYKPINQSPVGADRPHSIYGFQGSNAAVRTGFADYITPEAKGAGDLASETWTVVVHKA